MSLVAILFFVGSLVLVNPAQVYVSPDETANAYFSERFAESFSLRGPVNGLLLEFDRLHPRSTLVDDGQLIPGSFLGLPTIYGFVAAVLGDLALWILTPLLTVLAAHGFKDTVPFAHLVLPYQIMREIWRGSDSGDGDAATLQLASPGALLGWWWALMVSALLLEFYYPFWAQMTGGAIFGVKTAIDANYFYAEATSAALNIAAAILGILVVLSIDRMQSVKHQRTAATAATGAET